MCSAVQVKLQLKVSIFGEDGDIGVNPTRGTDRVKGPREEVEQLHAPPPLTFMSSDFISPP